MLVQGQTAQHVEGWLAQTEICFVAFTHCPSQLSHFFCFSATEHPSACYKLYQSPRMPSIDTLVLDSAPLLTCPVSTLQTLAKHFVTTVSVLAEIRDEKSRIALEQWQNVEGGLRVKQPTADAMAKGELAISVNCLKKLN